MYLRRNPDTFRFHTDPPIRYNASIVTIFFDLRKLFAIEELYSYFPNRPSPPFYIRLPGNPQLEGLSDIQRLATPVAVNRDAPVLRLTGLCYFAHDWPAAAAANRIQNKEKRGLVRSNIRCRDYSKDIFDAFEMAGNFTQEERIEIDWWRDRIVNLRTGRIRSLF